MELLNIRLVNEFGFAGTLIKSQLMIHLNDIIHAIDFQPHSDFIKINNNTLIVFGESKC